MDIIDGYNLLHRGAVALAEVEANGMRIDVDYLDKAIEHTGRRIHKLKERLRECPEYRLQRRRFGQNTNIVSRDQLATVLFDDMGHTPLRTTGTGKNQLDETALESIGTRYARGFLRLEKLNKLYGTYLTGIRREVVDGYIHAFFGLHLVRSYRGQSNDPNLQNVPIRDPIQGKVIRRAFIPRDGCALVEIDYSSLEVMVACAVSGDPKLTYDATEGDMHRDMAAECFLLDKSDVSKPTRQATKGGFVFAEFYGDWYKQVARNLWDAIDRNDLRCATDGRSMHDHLTIEHGIHMLGRCDPREEPAPGTFESHIKTVEDRFWNERFKVYHDKRREWVDFYKRNGYVDLVTGLRCYGPMTKNKIINYPVQGPAFHCLLWSLTRLVVETKRRRMGARIISQVHDSIIADVPIAELDDYLALAGDVATRQLRREWDWITVPLKVEAEVSTRNWYEKKEVYIPQEV